MLFSAIYTPRLYAVNAFDISIIIAGWLIGNINGLTAQPYGKYLELIGKMKKGKL